MTKEELEQLLGGEPLEFSIDIKTMVLDLVRDMPKEELLEIFWDKLPEIQEDKVRDYLYMKR